MQLRCRKGRNLSSVLSSLIPQGSRCSSWSKRPNSRGVSCQCWCFRENSFHVSTGSSWGTESSQEHLLTQPFQLWVSVSLRRDGKSAVAHHQNVVGGGALPNVGVCNLARHPWCKKKKRECASFSRGRVLWGRLQAVGRSYSICLMRRRAIFPSGRMLW